MRIGRVLPGNAYQGELQRSAPRAVPGPFERQQPGTEPDVIFDLTAEAVAQTGRTDIPYARQPRTPPETYTDSGTLAYYAPRDVPPDRLQEIFSPAPPDDEVVQETRVSLVTFDGMLRAPARDQIRLLLNQ